MIRFCNTVQKTHQELLPDDAGCRRADCYLLSKYEEDGGHFSEARLDFGLLKIRLSIFRVVRIFPSKIDADFEISWYGKVTWSNRQRDWKRL